MMIGSIRDQKVSNQEGPCRGCLVIDISCCTLVRLAGPAGRS